MDTTDIKNILNKFFAINSKAFKITNLNDLISKLGLEDYEIQFEHGAICIGPVEILTDKRDGQYIIREISYDAQWQLIVACNMPALPA